MSRVPLTTAKFNEITHKMVEYMIQSGYKIAEIFNRNEFHAYYGDDCEHCSEFSLKESYDIISTEQVCGVLTLPAVDVCVSDYVSWMHQIDDMDFQFTFDLDNEGDVHSIFEESYTYIDEYISTYHKFDVWNPVVENNKTTTKTTKGTTMSKTKEIVKNNTDSATQAMKMKLGNEVIKNVKKAIKPQVPMMVRGYLDSPFADVIIANIFITAQKQLKPDSEVLQSLSVATLDVAMYNVANLVDFDAILEKVTNGMDLTPLKKKK